MAAIIRCGYQTLTGVPCPNDAVQVVYDNRTAGHEPAQVPSCGSHDHSGMDIWVF